MPMVRLATARATNNMCLAFITPPRTRNPSSFLRLFSGKYMRLGPRKTGNEVCHFRDRSQRSAPKAQTGDQIGIAGVLSKGLESRLDGKTADARIALFERS